MYGRELVRRHSYAPEIPHHRDRIKTGSWHTQRNITFPIVLCACPAAGKNQTTASTHSRIGKIADDHKTGESGARHPPGYYKGTRIRGVAMSRSFIYQR